MVICPECGLHSTSGRMFTVGCEPCMKRVEMVKFLEELLATPPALPVKEWSRLEMMYPVAGIH